jgi:hypothetical protein
MKVVPSKPENGETAKRLTGVLKSLITGGFVRRKDVPEKVSEEEALAIIHRAINSEGAKKL